MDRTNRRGPRKNNFNKKDDRIQFPRITQKLSIEFSDPVDLYLPAGKANQYAKAFKGIKTHQMRKILNEVKVATLSANSDDFKTAKSKIFMIVAMTAYNAGRLSGNMRDLDRFISNTINQDSIQDVEDIKAFDQFFTSIVAYHTKISK